MSGITVLPGKDDIIVEDDDLNSESKSRYRFVQLLSPRHSPILPYR